MLISLVFIACSCHSVGYIGGFYWYYPIFLCSMLPLMSFMEDEKSRWDVYCDTFPYSRGQIVSVKYFVSFFFVLVISLVMGSINLTACPPELAVTIFASGLMIGLASPAIIFPFLFALGAAKGMIAYYIICILMGVGSVNAVANLVDETPMQLGIQYSMIGLIAVMFLFILSWVLSIRLYCRREL